MAGALCEPASPAIRPCARWIRRRSTYRRFGSRLPRRRRLRRACIASLSAALPDVAEEAGVAPRLLQSQMRVLLPEALRQPLRRQPVEEVAVDEAGVADAEVLRDCSRAPTP